MQCCTWLACGGEGWILSKYDGYLARRMGEYADWNSYYLLGVSYASLMHCRALSVVTYYFIRQSSQSVRHSKSYGLSSQSKE